MKTKLFLFILFISFVTLMNGCKTKCGDYPVGAEGLLPVKFQNKTCRYLMNSVDTIVLKAGPMEKEEGRNLSRCDKCICSVSASMTVLDTVMKIWYHSGMFTQSRKRIAKYDDIFKVNIRSDRFGMTISFKYNIRNHTYLEDPGNYGATSFVVLETYNVLGKSYEDVLKLEEGNTTAYFAINYGVIKLENTQKNCVIELINNP